MLDCRLLDLNTDRRQASSNLANPLVSSQNGKCGGHCFVDAPGGHFNGVLDSVQIGYRYPAAALRHAEHRSIFRYLFASIWGMNFHHMPELDEIWAYPVAIVMIIISGILPYIYFKRRGWL